MRIFKASLAIGSIAVAVAATLGWLGIYTPIERFFWGSPLPGGSWAVQWGAMLLLGFGLAWTTADIHQPILKSVVGATSLLEVTGLAWVLTAKAGIHWSPFGTLTAGALAFALGLYYSRTPGGSRKRRIAELFGPTRISRATAREILEADESLDLSGRPLQATVLVCEVLNRGALDKALSPHDYFALHTSFVRVATQTVVEAGGLLDAVGEGRLRALFGVPLTLRPHALDACRAAALLQERLDRFAEEALAKWKVPVESAVALETGDLLAAESEETGVLSVMGEVLDFTEQLAARCKPYGTRLLVGAEAYRRIAPQWHLRPVDLLSLPDQRGPEEIYEPLAPKGGLSPAEVERAEVFWKGVLYYRAHRAEEAKAHLEAVLYPEETACEDLLVRFYLQRLTRLRRGEPVERWALVKL